MASFELRKTEGGQFNFSLKNEEGKTLLKSEQYQSKTSAQNGIESVRKNSTLEHYALENSKDGKFYFNLKSSNGQVVGTSVLYATEAERAGAIAEVKKDAAKAKVEDHC
ncbi:MAG: YegP family protein [Neisseria sp.]|nr:YegP family protein [Neisseria sp.]